MMTKKTTKQSRRTAARKARQQGAWRRFQADARRRIGRVSPIEMHKLERASFFNLRQRSKQYVVENFG